MPPLGQGVHPETLKSGLFEFPKPSREFGSSLAVSPLSSLITKAFISKATLYNLRQQPDKASHYRTLYKVRMEERACSLSWEESKTCKLLQ